MQPESPNELARRWLADARSEMAVAASPLLEGVWPSVWCMHAQRAAEKAIKAVFEEQQLEIPPRERKTHSIEALVGKLNLPVVPPKLSNAFVLTKYAVDTHYIDDLGDPVWVKDQEIAPAVQLAEAVVEWAASIIEAPTEA